MEEKAKQKFWMEMRLFILQKFTLTTIDKRMKMPGF